MEIVAAPTRKTKVQDVGAVGRTEEAAAKQTPTWNAHAKTQSLKTRIKLIIELS